MKVVIDIPEEQLGLIRNKIESIRSEIAHNGYAKSDLVPAGWVAIADGTILSKTEWEDYSIDFYRCPECGYLLNKDCPNCGNKVVLPLSDIGGNGE